MSEVKERSPMSVTKAVELALEEINGGIGPINSRRFDLLCEVRDEVQALIDEEREGEHQRIANELDRLREDLSAKESRLAAIAVQPKRKTRSDAGTKRGKKSPIIEKGQTAL